MSETKPASQRTFLGHPAGLSVLFGTEMWERFCYYGNTALLTYYMVDFLFTDDRPQTIIGYTAVKAFFEMLYGPLAAQPFAALVVGLFGAGTYLTGLAGGAIADGYLGQKRAVILGAVIMSAAEFMLTAPSLFFLGLLTFVIGVGFLKPNIATQVGGLYEPGDARIDRAYSIFYIGINLGALIAPLIVAPLGHAAAGEPPRWHWGFAAAGVAMLLGLAVFVTGLRFLPPDVRARRKIAQSASPLANHATKLSFIERRTVAALFMVAICGLFFWGCYFQQYSTIALMAENNTNLSIGFATLYPEDVQSINPFFVFTLTPAVIAVWAWQARRGREPAPVTKMALGCVATALCFGLLVIPGMAIDRGEHVTVLWLVAALAFQTIGELYLSPVGLSLFSQAAPAKYASVLMGVNFLSLSGGSYLAGHLAHFWSAMPKSSFFAMIAGLAAATAVGLFALSFILNPMLKTREPEVVAIPG